MAVTCIYIYNPTDVNIQQFQERKGYSSWTEQVSVAAVLSAMADGIPPAIALPSFMV
jgi:hypothetical protein